MKFDAAHIEAWRERLAILRSRLTEEFDHLIAYSWHLEIESIVYLLKTFAQGDVHEAVLPAPAVPPPLPQQPLTAPRITETGGGSDAKEADAIDAEIALQQAQAEAESARLHLSRDEWEDIGKQPRNAAQLRGPLDRLVNANARRNAEAEADCREARAQLQAKRRELQFYAPLQRYGLMIGAAEFPRFVRTQDDGLPDFTLLSLYQYLHSKYAANCESCKYDLRGLPPSGSCPECGAVYLTGMTSWPALCRKLQRPGTPTLQEQTCMMHWLELYG